MERLIKLVNDHGGSPEEFIQTLEKTIKSFIGDTPQFDDLTSLAFKAI